MHTAAVLQVPEEALLRDACPDRLPCASYPSDHLLLVADLDLYEQPPSAAAVRAADSPATTATGLVAGLLRGQGAGAAAAAVAAVVLLAAGVAAAALAPLPSS